MTCKNCGTPATEEQAFCAVCGAPLAEKLPHEPVDSTPAAEPVEIAPAPADSVSEEMPAVDVPAPEREMAAPAGEAFVPAAVIPAAAEVAEAPTAAGPKHKLGWIIALAALIAIVTGVALSWGYIGNFIDRTFLSPADYYHKVEKRALHAGADELSRSVGPNQLTAGLFGGERADEATRGSVTLSVGEALTSLLSDGLGADMSWLKSVGLDYVLDTTRPEMTGYKASLQLNGADIIGVDGMYHKDSRMSYMRIPELSDRYAAVNLEEVLSDYYWSNGADGTFQLLSALVYGEQSELQGIFAAFPSPKTMAALMERYGGIIIDGLTDVTRGKESIVAEGVKGNYTALTVKADRAALEKILRDVLAAAAGDAQVKELMVNLITQMGQDGEAAYTAFQREIQALLREETLIADDVRLQMKVFVDGKGDIHGRDLSIVSAEREVFHVGCLYPVDGSRFGFSFQMYGTDSGIISVTGSGTTRKNDIKGTFVLRTVANGTNMELLTVDVDGSSKGGNFYGEMTLAPSEALMGTLLANADIPRELQELVRSMKLRIINHSSGDKPDMKLALVSGQEELLALLAEGAPASAMELTIPADAADLEEWAGSLNQLSLMKLIGNLQQAGLPTSFLMELGALS